jgi:hypothetical protein
MYSRASADAGRSMDPTAGTTAADGRRSFSSSVAEELDGHFECGQQGNQQTASDTPQQSGIVADCTVLWVFTWRATELERWDARASCCANRCKAEVALVCSCVGNIGLRMLMLHTWIHVIIILIRHGLQYELADSMSTQRSLFVISPSRRGCVRSKCTN